MSRAIPTDIPAQFRAGETLTFKLSLPDYPATEWDLTFSFRASGGSKIDFTGTDDGDDHLIEVAFTDTVGWLPGDYVGVALAESDTQKFEVWRGSRTVLPDIAAAEEGKDFRTQARRTLDNINAVIEGRAGSTILESSVEGTQLRRIPYEDLLKLQARYETKVANEENAAATAQGKPSRKTVLARFTTPR